MIFEKSQQSGKVPGDWKNGNIAPIFKMDEKEETTVSLSSIPEKMMEQILLEVIVRHMEREVIQDSFTESTSDLKVMSCFSNATSYYKFTDWCDFKIAELCQNYKIEGEKNLGISELLKLISQHYPMDIKKEVFQ
ncbi:hypothetical protein TURU_158357 [Turdus rufiventris]|nr:hypothetical protein TURU_158357 [Turdus rufiventris]